MGFAATMQSLLARHSAQVPDAESQTGVAALRLAQAVSAAAWQPTQALTTQNDLAASLHSVSETHSTHRPEEASHTGAAGVFFAQLSGAIAQETQAFITHEGAAAAVQNESSVHATHRPVPTSQAFSACFAQSGLPLQPWHRPARQTGFCAGHSLASLHVPSASEVTSPVVVPASPPSPAALSPSVMPPSSIGTHRFWLLQKYPDRHGLLRSHTLQLRSVHPQARQSTVTNAHSQPDDLI
jgi:hypothetical protein